MKLIYYEMLKVFKKRILWTAMVLLILGNGVLYYKEQMNNNAYLIENLNSYYSFEQSYKQMSLDLAISRIARVRDELAAYTTLTYSLQDHNDMAVKQALKTLKEANPNLLQSFSDSPYLDDSESLKRDFYFANLIYGQYQEIQDYERFIDGLQDRADTMLSASIFQNKGSFSYRNIVQTPEDFRHLQNIRLEIGLDKGIFSGTSYRVTDIAVAMLIFLLCIYLFLHEKEADLMRLIRVNRKGRLATVTAKLVLLAATTIGLCFLFYGSILLISHHLYGFGDLSRFIQSIAGLNRGNLLLSIQQYLVLFMTGKLLFNLVLAMMFAFFFVSMKHASVIYMSLCAFIGASLICYVMIPSQSYFSLAKHINLFMFSDTTGLLTRYINTNVFGTPVQNIWLSASSMTILLIVLPLISAFIFVKQHPTRSQSLLFRLWNRIRERIFRPTRSTRVFVHESFKAWFLGKGFLVCCIAGMIGINHIHFNEVRFNEEEAIYNKYLMELSGELNATKIRRLEEEKSFFDHLPQELESNRQAFSEHRISVNDYTAKAAELGMFAQKRNSFDKVYQQYQYLLALKKEKGIEAALVNEIASDYVFNNKFRDILNAISISVLIMLFSSSIFTLDDGAGMVSLLRCTKKGRFTLYANKHAVAYLTAILFTILIYIPQYINLIKGYNFNSWRAPVQSIRLFEHVDIPMRVIDFVMFVNFLQLLGVLIVTQIVLWISLVAKRQSVALLIASVVFLCPLFIQLGHFDFIRSFTGNNLFLLYTEFAENGAFQDVFWYFAVALGIGISAGLLSWRKYNGNSRVL